ncbi:MAG: hypothetical protein Ct9H300mP11_32790 [Chloroflexota bacterium]|nr:MAG: hypothetical protein Ct9H300mP11_32790 [Chloroflexota bacterium]
MCGRYGLYIGSLSVIAVDLKDDKLELAKEFGATHLVNASRTDPVEAIHEISNGGVGFAMTYRRQSDE